MPEQLTLARISEAAAFLETRIRRTPMEHSRKLSEMLGVPTWLKLESLQITGSFKIRGAFFRLSRLSSDERKAGVVTCSAGNHGKACAHAARELGLRITIYVPKSVDEAKYRGMVAMGADVIVSELPGYDDTEELAKSESRKKGQTFVSAFDDFDVMAGNGGTLAIEIVEDLPRVINFIVPLGGGGLGAGLAFYVKERVPGARVVACQHEQSPGLRLSLEQGRAVTRLPAVETIAGGIEGGIGELTFGVLRERVDHIAHTNDREIATAMCWVLAEHQYLIEPTAAAVIAACLKERVGALSGPTVVILSGRNVSEATIGKILCPELIMGKR